MRHFIGGFCAGQIALWVGMYLVARTSKKSVTADGLLMLYVGIIFGLAAWGLLP